MSYEFIITEKPAAALKLANALGDTKPKKKNIDSVPYYELEHKGSKIVIGSAVGHLFSLREKNKQYTYPSFDIEWVESSKVNKSAKFTKKYIKAIKFLAKHASSFTVATDYDIEGEVIGINVIRFICGEDDAQRMKFSTLTKPDLIESYNKKLNTIDWGQAKAGLTRHMLDWYYGINLSRALTTAIKKAGQFKILSIGRVQGPALKIVVEREREIKKFKPVPFWQIELNGHIKEDKDKKIIAWHEKDKIWDKKEAEDILEKTKNKNGIINNIKKRSSKQQPPNPFDLTSLQIEAYKLFKITPKKTLEIAQELYTSGYISYPRTSSQQLPENIGYKKILTQLKRNSRYKDSADALLKLSKLKPNNGKKTDPAHPAIYPTGIVPELSGQELKIYDLIVKRFLATFGNPAIRETVSIYINVNNEMFIAKGTRTIEEGWHKFYRPYVKLEEQELPHCEINDEITVKKITLHSKETQPPNRYTQASLIKELEKQNLGTKATRASIIDTLYERGYIEGKQIQATIFGIKTIETLEKFSPMIINVELTRKFEDEMELIREGKKKEEDVLENAKKILIKILDEFRKKELEIGKELLKSNREATKIINTLGPSPNEKEGNLIITKGKYGQYIKSDREDCKKTFSLPNNVLIKPAKKNCPECNYPMVKIYKKGQRPKDFCINPDCPSKKSDEKSKNEGKTCPKCKTGKLILRKSVYGEFLGCSNYPKCKYTEQIGDKEDPYM